eukprot:TRINITY_DN22255_c1_g1_i1.p1 TRINITY_DN22255_c1_g1~~TRINITY_DN22255_c1_g1_i1.p1  ORF type:complete len:351 (-),score=45.09 TRINITY_DN22255_c1_g1_i1:110-1162(-)
MANRFLSTNRLEELKPRNSYTARQRGGVDGRRQVMKILVTRRIASDLEIICDKAPSKGFTLDVRLSKQGLLFPGTFDRICVLDGPPAELETYIRWIVAQTHLGRGSSNFKTPVLRLRLSVPNSAVGAFLGKGGATIKHIQLVSKCKISVSQRMTEIQERIVTISSFDDVGLLEATMSIVSAIQDNQHLIEHMKVDTEIHEPRIVNPELAIISLTEAANLTKRQLVSYLMQAAPREVLVDHSLVGPADRIVRSSNFANLLRAAAIVWERRRVDSTSTVAGGGGRGGGGEGNDEEATSSAVVDTSSSSHSPSGTIEEPWAWDCLANRMLALLPEEFGSLARGCCLCVSAIKS